MDQTLEILKYLLPSLVVMITTIYLVAKYFSEEERRRKQQLYLNNQNITLPLRLQAYERVILFLERISPENLIMRVNKPGYSTQQLQAELLNAIRAEYEHNLSQQLYVSQGAWEMLKNARGRTIQFINQIADKVAKDTPSINLSRAILESIVDQEKIPASDAIEFVKKEFEQNFK
jgi:hypothetical protein